MQLKVGIIGAGNVATHLGIQLKAKGCAIVQVYSRTEESAKDLAEKLDTRFTIHPGQIVNTADVYFVVLKDSAIEEVLGQVDVKDKLLVHCSGSMPLEVLRRYSKNTGVLYPLQTFSRNRKLNFKDIPLFVEASSKPNEERLLGIANSLSGKVELMNSERRKSLHLAAVLACNFTNHLYAMAAEYLQSNNIPFDVLRPLIMETASKVQQMPPKNAQTGPAVRYDENIIDKHIAELQQYPGYQELYNLLSKSIFEYHKENR